MRRVLIENLLGSTELDSEVRRRIADAAGGTPLFVEEMLGKLIDEDLLHRSDGRWIPRVDLSDVPVPTTIAALLAARIDQLGLRSERSSNEQRSEVSISSRARSAGCPIATGRLVDECLASLVRKDLIRPDRSSLPGEDAYRFRHVLIRDAAYEAMPKQLRAKLHERFASWLEVVVGDGMTEQEEILGYHLEQALSYRAELHLDRDPTLVRQAVGYARRTQVIERRSASTSCRSSRLLERAAALLPDDDPERIRLMADAGVAMNRHRREPPRGSDPRSVIGSAHRSGDVLTESRASDRSVMGGARAEPSLWLEVMRADRRAARSRSSGR